MDIINSFIESNFSVLSVLIIILLVILSMYNSIKFKCLKQACEKIVDAENHTELTGSEKFALVVKWIIESLPSVFRIILLRSLIEKITQYAYDTSVDYMKKYIKRKTGYDVSKLLDEIKNNEENNNE